MTGWAILIPELYLAAAAMLLLLYGVYREQRANAVLSLAGAVVAGLTAWMVCSHYRVEATVMNGMFTVNAFTSFAKCLLLLAGMLAMLLSSGWITERGLPARSLSGSMSEESGLYGGFASAEAGGRPYEFMVLMLFALLGMMLMVSANDLLALYLALEMSSLALYVLASFERDHIKSSEAGLKYFVLGALASGMMLFGMSLVYGFAGATNFDALSQVFSLSPEASKGAIFGLVLIIVGFCFKISAVPFHMWTPDVYEGAPTPVVAFFATAPKIAALALFARLLLEPFGGLLSSWQQVIVAASALSMLVGALAAIWQTNIKRLLAYSSISHVGFMLMGLAAGNLAGLQAMLIYLSLYVFMSVGAFGCVLMMQRGGRPAEEIKDLSGLSQTQPVMAALLAVFMFSMAGIPPLAGFFGKLYVILAAIDGGLMPLAVIAVAASVIGCYYYIKIVKVMYFDEPVMGFDAHSPLLLKASLAAGAAVTLLFFLMPSPLVHAAAEAAQTILK